jgi:hypothetical protein
LHKSLYEHSYCRIHLSFGLSFSTTIVSQSSTILTQSITLFNPRPSNLSPGNQPPTQFILSSVVLAIEIVNTSSG